MLASALGGTAGELRIERAFCIAGGDVVDPNIREGAAVENDTAHGLRVLAHVRLREGRAVRAAVKIDLPVPERAPDGFHVVRGDARRVQPRIRVEMGETGSQIAADGPRVSSAHVPVGAGETARPARAALVDHDEIARSPHLCEEGVHGQRGGGRRPTGTAFEVEQRAGCRLFRRRQYRDSQGNRRPLQLARIKRHAQAPTPAVDVAAVCAGDKPRRAARRPPPLRTPGKPDDNPDSRHRRDRDQQPNPARQAAAGRPPILTPIAQKTTIRADTHR